MRARLNRRHVLAGMAGGLLAAAALPRARGQAAAALEAVDLGADLVLIRGAGANVTALGAASGVLAVDGGSPERAQDLLALLAQRFPGRGVDILFNTNWRSEHTGANEAVRAAGGTVMAHENTKLWQGGDFFVDWEDRHYSPKPAAALPNETFYTSGALDVGGRTVEYLYLPRAHTDGDVAVYFRDANVLAVSDLLAVGAYPLPDYATGGWIGGLQAATRALLDATDARTRIVAADGPVHGRAALEAQLELCTTVRERVAQAFRAGMSFADFAASRPTQEFDAERGDPQLFLRLVYKGGFAHIRELGGTI